MTIAYVDKKNQRAIGSELLIVNESHIVGTTAVASSSPNQIRTYEVPLQESPSSVAIPGYTEVAGSPGTNEFRVDYTNGRITFNAAANGNTVFVTYKGRGSIVDAEDVNELQGPVGVALDYDGEITAGHVKPVSISTNIAHDFTFPNDVVVTGNLTVNGTSSSFNTEIVTIEDNIVLLNSNVVGAPTLDAGLEIERGTSPNVTFLWDEGNDSWQLNNTSGSPIIEAFDTGAVTIAGTVSLTGPILIGDGTVNNPAYSFSLDTDTGLYRDSANSLSITTNATRRWSVDSGGALTSYNSSLILNSDGTAAVPSYSFGSDSNTGLYRIGADNIGISTSGTKQWEITSSGNMRLQQRMYAASAGYYFNIGGGAEDQNGMRWTGSNINFSLAANDSMSLGNSVVTISPFASPITTFNSSGASLATGRFRAPTIGVGVEPLATFHNSGSTLLGMTTASNPGSIATATVDSFSGTVVTTSAAISVSVSAPTDTTSGRFFTVMHNDTSTGTLSVNGQSVGVGKGVPFMWDGTTWIPVGGAGSFNLIAGDPGSPQTGDTWFDTVTSQFKGWNGASIVILG